MSSPSSSGLLVRTHQPQNLESPFSALHGATTPNDRFFVRSHFDPPQFDRETWRLRVQGLSGKPIALSLDDIEKIAPSTQTAVIECSGNGRLFLDTAPEGVQWELGAIGCASWTGVRLAAVLDHAGIQHDALELVFEGADHGVPEKSLKPKGEIHYARSLPLPIARQPEILLAYKMNGESLPAAHGAPLRLIVPGWYGVSSVKWLAKITAVKEQFQGYFQTVEYAYWKDRGNGSIERVPITTLSIKSQISQPAVNEQIPLGVPYRIRGAAWTANAEITTVEVSVDGGVTWTQANLDPPGERNSWRLWECNWTPAAAGAYTLMSRARDSAGRVQPSRHDENHESYMIHHTLPITVKVA